MRNPPEPNKGHPFSTCWSSRGRSDAIDTEQARTMKGLHHGIFGNVSYQFSKIYSFVWLFGCYQFDLLLFFERIFSPTLYCACSRRVMQRNPISTSFSSAIRRNIMDRATPYLDQLFFSRLRCMHIACVIVPIIRTAWKDYQQIISDFCLHCKR